MILAGGDLEVKVPTVLVDVINRLLKVDELLVGPVGKWAPIEAALIDHGMLTVEHDVPVEKVLVHTDNRSYLMVNPIGFHSTLAMIKRVGAKKSALEANAIAVELCPVGKLRDDQINANKALVAKSEGLMKPVMGDEKILSLGSSHATQGFAAAFHGCKTPEQTLQDCTGCVDVNGWIATQPVVATIKASGFSWRVIKWQVPAMWPKIPDLASRAYNGTGAVAAS